MSSRISSLTTGSTDRSTDIVGVQDSDNRRFTLHPAALRPPATSAEVRTGSESAKTVSPSSLRGKFSDIENDLSHAWGSWDALTLVSSSTEGIAADESSGLIDQTGYPSGLAYFKTTDVDLAALIPATPANTLYEGAALIFNGGIANPPSLPSPLDEWYTGLVIERADGTFLLMVRWQLAGIKVYSTTNITNPSWADVAGTSEVLAHNAHGVRADTGWHLAASDASNNPPEGSASDFANVPWAIKRIGTTLHAIALGHLGDLKYRIAITEQEYQVGSASNLADGSVTLPKISTSGAASGNVPTYNGTNIVWQTPSGGDGGIKIVDAAADLPNNPDTDDLVIVGASATFYSGGVSFYTGRTYRYTGSAWALVSRPLSANDLSTGTVDDDRLPSDISQSKIGASAAEGRLLLAGSGTTANWRAANYVKGMADGTEFSGTNFVKHPIGTVFEIVGDFTIAGGNSHAGSYKQGERWRKTGASAVTKMTAAAPTSITAAMLDAGSATDGQVLTATGSNGGVAWEDSTGGMEDPGGTKTIGRVPRLIDSSGTVEWRDVVVGYGGAFGGFDYDKYVVFNDSTGIIEVKDNIGSPSPSQVDFQIGTVGIRDDAVTNAKAAADLCATEQYQDASVTPAKLTDPAKATIPAILDLDDLWGTDSTYTFPPATANAPANLRGTGFVHTHNNVQIVDMTSDSNRWHRARTATYGTLGSVSSISSPWEGWTKISSSTNLDTAAAGRYVWYGGTDSSAVPVNAPLIGESGSNGYEASAADRVAIAVVAADYQVVAHGSSVLPNYNTGNSLSVRRKTGNTWGAWTRIKNTLTNAITALAGIPDVVSDPEQIPAGSTDWHLVVPHEAFAATKHPLAASGGATNFYFCRFSTTAGTTIQFVYGEGTSSTQRARRREATFTLAAGSWTRFGLHVT